MAQYRKKPVIIEAIEWTGKNLKEILLLAAGSGREIQQEVFGDHLIIPTLEGNHEANIGDFIIKGVKGEVYPCKPDIFKMTYEKV